MKSNMAAKRHMKKIRKVIILKDQSHLAHHFVRIEEININLK